MSILSIVLTGFGLAMDAFAVSVAKGITLTRVKAMAVNLRSLIFYNNV
ncbi:membrane protein [Clostridium perfringens D str. JGS1721]|uniref:Membrane protein n=1 Tax=Clostridium perfringens D str. JGS1721 TaxID=488537 RepID=B1V238_CLOPF|nr:hypothetical protein [Clostridium perfringens]EDT72125.1 membrane protein [Clostridium perfringens D str. JGS1721]